MSSGFDQRATDIECPAVTWTFSTGRTSATVHFARYSAGVSRNAGSLLSCFLSHTRWISPASSLAVILALMLSRAETEQCRLTGELCSVLLGCTDYSLLNDGYISIYSV